MLSSVNDVLPEPVRLFIRMGYVAVGTFFVLSGFVLTRRYATTDWTRRSLYRYAVSRFARIYPVYALSLVIILPFMLMDFRPAWIANYVLVLQGWFGAKAAVSWNTPAWSLTCEIFFYCLFPLVLFLVRPRGWISVLALTVVGCLLTSWLRRFHMSEELKPFLHFSDFLIGIAAGGAYGLLQRRRIQGVWLYLPASIAAAALVAFPVLVFSWATLNGLLRPLNAVLLVGLAFGGGWLARFLSTAPVVFLGKASYALYILHVPLLWWWKFVDPVNPLPRPVSGVLYLIAVIAITGWVHHKFEEPANSRVRSYLNG